MNQRGCLSPALQTLTFVRDALVLLMFMEFAHYFIAALMPYAQPRHVSCFPLTNGVVHLVLEYHLFLSLTEPKNRSSIQ